MGGGGGGRRRGGEGDDDPALLIGSFKCSAVRTGPTTVLVALLGFVEAQRAVTGVRIVGFAEGLLVGAQFLGDISAGGTRNFVISGEILFTGSELNCNILAIFDCSRPRYAAPGRPAPAWRRSSEGCPPSGRRPGSASAGLLIRPVNTAPVELDPAGQFSAGSSCRNTSTPCASRIATWRTGTRRYRCARRPTRLAAVAEIVWGQRFGVEFLAVPVQQDQRERSVGARRPGPLAGCLRVRQAPLPG